MATRCTIKLEGFKTAKVYKHYDGYPEATLAWLEDFNSDFTSKRGDDNQYKFAQLLRSSAFDSETYNLDASRHTGWGVIGYKETCGEEYVYTLKLDGTVKVKYLYADK